MQEVKISKKLLNNDLTVAKLIFGTYKNKEKNHQINNAALQLLICQRPLNNRAAVPKY